eukprot:scaffold614_cov367-Prasinococcus_capsulatus_cf.AAC.1
MQARYCAEAVAADAAQEDLPDPWYAASILPASKTIPRTRRCRCLNLVVSICVRAFCQRTRVFGRAPCVATEQRADNAIVYNTIAPWLLGGTLGFVEGALTPLLSSFGHDQERQNMLHMDALAQPKPAVT